MAKKGEQIIRGKTNGVDFVECRDSKRIQTVDQLLKAAKVDLTKWQVKDATINKYESATMPRATGNDKNGWARKSTKPMLVELFQIKVWLKPIDQTVTLVSASHDRLLAGLEDLGKRKVTSHCYAFSSDKGKMNMAEMGIVDLHMGKYSRAVETNSDYDLQIAEQCFRGATDHFLEKMSRDPIEKIVWPVGHDAMHFSTQQNSTPSGNPMDVSGRYFEVYECLMQNYVWAIERSLEVAPVEFYYLPGNHDPLVSFHAARELAAYFRHQKHVTFNIGPKTRKYIEYGINMIGWSHGNREDIKTLPVLMAKEEPEIWGRTRQREIHIGHKHLLKIWAESFAGIRVRILGSMSGHDAWHYGEGYQDRRTSECFIWNYEHGEAAHYNFNINPS